ncbi:hypothetical protein BVRB_6g136030 [Beta vulgaris subsp. vulgaris]|nr:hypothetical protein BVRB_6g136030 [Beta vulgaris subsp. vulgaris]
MIHMWNFDSFSSFCLKIHGNTHAVVHTLILGRC